MTDFGETGNLSVAETFENYVSANPKGASSRQIKSSPAPRLMITGFGLFQNIRFNPSGSLIESLANEQFWPSNGNLPGFPRCPAAQGKLSENDYGAKVFTRQIQINGTAIDLCLINFDVKWDLAGAILVHEMRSFQPDLAIMTGRGQSDVIMEGGTLNRAIQSPGFDSTGKSLFDTNKPRSNWILEHLPADAEIKLSWENSKFGLPLAGDIERLGYQLKIQTQARADNNYICNSLSLIGASAARGDPISLAGGQIRFEAEPVSRLTRIGFLHLPTIDTQFASPDQATSTIFGFAQFVLSFAARSLSL